MFYPSILPTYLSNNLFSPLLEEEDSCMSREPCFLQEISSLKYITEHMSDQVMNQTKNSVSCFLSFFFNCFARVNLIRAPSNRIYVR